MVDTSVGIEVISDYVINLLEELQENSCQDHIEKELSADLRRTQEEAEKARRRAWMDSIAISKAQDRFVRVVRYWESFSDPHSFKNDVRRTLIIRRR